MANKPKKKKSAADEAKLFKAADEGMALFVVESRDRYEKAQILFQRQDDETRDAVERMAALLTRIARKQMWFSVGKRDDRLVREIPEEARYHNSFYTAVEILKDLAFMDVRVAAFVLPTDLCAECYQPIKVKKAVKKK